ncbi:hypothetical protein CLV31_101456 [Algoriphagus aquaeductus]|nr:hypothetical protein CLV31_101456 [Algoriphagus aquaeductus]
MKKLLFACLIFLFVHSVRAQEQVIPHRSVYMELGGAGLA